MTMKSKPLYLTACLALAAMLSLSAQAPLSDMSFGIDLTGMDRSVRPQDDFYRFVNGKWDDTTPIPADMSIYGTFAILRDRRAYFRRVALWQAVDWSFRLVAIFFFLRAFGLPATIHNALLVQVSAGLASLLPISPSGIGTEQAFLLYLLRDQASRASLLGFSVGMRITIIVVNLALGFTALLVTLKTVRWREHVAHSPR